MASGMTVEQRRQAEQIVRRWIWAVRLSAPNDRTVEQGAIGEMAVALLDQLLRDHRGHGRLDAA